MCVQGSARKHLVSAIQSAPASFRSAFVSKLSAAGNSLSFSTYFAGDGLDYGNGITVDAVGNAYVVGDTGSSNFPIASLQDRYGGGLRDAFITKIDFAVTPRLTAEGVVNAASFLGGSVAPGEIVSIFGSDLGPTVGTGGHLDANGLLDTLVAETQLSFRRSGSAALLRSQ